MAYYIVISESPRSRLCDHHGPTPWIMAQQQGENIHKMVLSPYDSHLSCCFHRRHRHCLSTISSLSSSWNTEKMFLMTLMYAIKMNIYILLHNNIKIIFIFKFSSQKKPCNFSITKRGGRMRMGGSATVSGEALKVLVTYFVCVFLLTP